VPAPEASTAIRASTKGDAIRAPAMMSIPRAKKGSAGSDRPRWERYPSRVPDPQEQTAARPGRCANHPAVALVGMCDVCGRSLCITCAVPVRGRLIGPECLPEILEDVVSAQPLAHPVRPTGDRLALLGFGLVMVLSALPWSRFGDSPRYFGAWAVHWSLLAAAGGLGGLATVLIGRYRSIDPRLETAAYALFAIVIGVGGALQYLHPPLLSDSTVWPLVAVIAAALALLGAMVKLAALRSVGRPPR
jgi:hypothetical protein